MRAFDSTRPTLIPGDAAAVLPYADGKYAWPLADIARFPRARRRYITVLGNPMTASICDVERFDVPPEHAPTFIRHRRILFPGTLPTIYCNRVTLPAVQEHCRGLEYRVWLATLDGSIPQHITGGGQLCAVQFRGGPDDDYDVTEVIDPAWLRPVQHP